MVHYNLEIVFTDEQLDILNKNGAEIVVAKKGPVSGPNVAWQVWSPLKKNVLSWEERYGIYASDALYNNGVTLTKLAATPVGTLPGRCYNLGSDASISGPDGPALPGAFTITNNYPCSDGYLTMGLYQDAVVNGTVVPGHAVAAALVLYERAAAMDPGPGIYIWLQTGRDGNTVVTKCRSQMTFLEFSREQDAMTVTYNAESGRFSAISSCLLTSPAEMPGAQMVV